ncbi:MAG: hypothetical protein KAW92_00650 [Candidatus Cloacimonetes bacterium]|nr:hypothetical protein [Candidatus Cloacimonadota bacterium]
MKERELTTLLEAILSDSKKVIKEFEILKENDEEYFENIRKITQFEDLSTMFKRWQELINYKLGGKK